VCPGRRHAGQRRPRLPGGPPHHGDGGRVEEDVIARTGGGEPHTRQPQPIGGIRRRACTVGLRQKDTVNPPEQLEAVPSLYEGDEEVHRIAIRGRAVGNLPQPESDESRRKGGRHAPAMTRTWTSRLRKSYLTEREFRRIRVKAIVSGVLVHLLVVIGLFLLWEQKQK